MQHRDKIIFEKIINEINIAQSMMGESSQADFLQNEMLKRAIGMTAINIGELVKNVTAETRSRYKDIPWKAVAGMRDITAHKYGTLRMEEVYTTVHVDFPFLKQILTDILQKGL